MTEIPILLPPEPVEPVPIYPTNGSGPVVTPPIVTPEPAPLPAPEPEYGAPEALPELGWLSALIVLLGLIALAAALVDALNSLATLVFSRIPGFGTPRIKDTKTFLQPVSNKLGQWESKIDADIGLSFTKLAQVVGGVGESILAGELATYQAVARIAGLEGSVGHQAALHAQAKQSTARAQATAETALQHAVAAAAAASTGAAAANGHAVTLEHSITHLIEPELDALRHRIHELERGATVAWDELSKHSEALSIAGVTAATAVALTRLGADWTRCDSNRAIGERLCGATGNNLSRLLAGGLPLLAFADLCEVLRVGSALVQSGPVQGSLGFGADAVAGLLSCTGAERSAPLGSVYFQPGALTALGTPGVVTGADGV